MHSLYTNIHCAMLTMFRLTYTVVLACTVLTHAVLTHTVLTHTALTQGWNGEWRPCRGYCPNATNHSAIVKIRPSAAVPLPASAVRFWAVQRAVLQGGPGPAAPPRAAVDCRPLATPFVRRIPLAGLLHLKKDAKQQKVYSCM
jgi:hypothetical protein